MMDGLIKSVLLFIVLYCIQLTFKSIQAQNWPKIYGDPINALAKNLSEAYDKGLILTAYTTDNAGTPRYGWIIKNDINEISYGIKI
jgi:hypothetical protein